MFSGRWPEQSLLHDAKGRVFLDFNPVCFRSLLNDLLYEERHPGCNAVCSLYPRSACATHPCHSHRRDLLDMVRAGVRLAVRSKRVPFRRRLFGHA